MTNQLPVGLGQQAYAVIDMVATVTGIRWDPAQLLKEADGYFAHEYGKDAAVAEGVSVSLFHLTEDDYHCVGADRWYKWSEFPAWIKEWYDAELEWFVSL